MFNGIIKYTGTIKNIYKKNKNCTLEIRSKMKVTKKEIGSSISCSGACLTVESAKNNIITFYLSRETLNKTTFKLSKNNDIINLEKSIKYGDRVSGHFVQGHVDTTALIKKIKYIGKSWLIDLKILNKHKKFLVQKGSITVNGVSLTVAEILMNGFRIAIIPKTLKLTNLIFLKEKDFVNIEFDVLGKYIKNFVK